MLTQKQMQTYMYMQKLKENEKELRSMRFINKRVLITGGSSGIGLATAKIVSEEGGQAIIVGRNMEKLHLAKQKLKETDKVYSVDVTSEEQVSKMFEKLEDVDHIVTAAGPPAGDMPLLDLPVAKAKEMFESKYWGQYYCVKYGVPKLRKDGSIILFSGWISRKPMAGLPTFAAIDGAIESLTRVLSKELAPIRINAVAPGVIETPLWDSIEKDTRKNIFKSFADKLPVGRIGQTTDVAKTLIFLMNNDFVTGSIVDVDGGQN